MEKQPGPHCAGKFFGYANPTPRLRLLGEIYLFSCAHAISNGDRNHPMSALRAELALSWREIRIWQSGASNDGNRSTESADCCPRATQPLSVLLANPRAVLTRAP